MADAMADDRSNSKLHESNSNNSNNNNNNGWLNLYLLSGKAKG